MSLSQIKYSAGHILTAAAIGIVLGVAGGGLFAIHEADQIIARINSVHTEALQNASEEENQYKEALAGCTGSGLKLLDRVKNDEGDGTNTVIYERTPPTLKIAITGIHGLPILPMPSNGHAIPRLLIPGRVQPIELAPDGDAAPGMVYFYVDAATNTLHGPMPIETVTPQ